MKWSDLFWGRPIEAVASVGLAAAAFWKLPVWIVVCAGFLVVHATVGWIRERSVAGRLGANHGDVLRRALHLVGDLADLTAKRFDLWMIDLYLPKNVRGRFKQWPFVSRKFLVRELSVAVGRASEPPRQVPLTDALFGSCFSEGEPKMWWDRSVVDMPPGTSEGEPGSTSTMDDVRWLTCGLVSVYPLVDSVGGNCQGLLVIHVDRDAETVTKVLGALMQHEGKRRIRGACNDIHDKIRKK